MSMITFSENHESSLIAFEEGQALASMHDPRGEGLKWAYSLGGLPAEHVIVVGLGAGFHIAALADVDPDVRITVIESRESLIPVFRSQFPELEDRVEIRVVQDAQELFKSELFQEILNHRSFVLSFQECWGQQADFFTELFSHLTGRSLDSLKYHFQEFGINMKALYNLPRHNLSINEIASVVEASAMAENKKQIFRVLGELVK